MKEGKINEKKRFYLCRIIYDYLRILVHWKCHCCGVFEEDDVCAWSIHNILLHYYYDFMSNWILVIDHLFKNVKEKQHCVASYE